MNRKVILLATLMCTGFVGITQKMNPPQNVKASDGDYPEYIKITWQTLSNNALYKVFRNEAEGSKTPIEITKGWQQANFMIDRNQIIAGKRYAYSVKAKVNNIETDMSTSDIGYVAAIAEPDDTTKKISLNNDDKLNISLQALEKDTLVAKDSFYVAYAVFNKSQEQMNQLELRFYLSKNNIPEANDPIVGSIKVDKLMALGSRRGSVRLKADTKTQAGQYCLVMVSYRESNSNKTSTSYKKVMIQ